MKQHIYLFSLSLDSDVINVKSLEIDFFTPKIDFSNYDYLIVTSKQASKALLNYDKKEYVSKKALCISEATAKSFEDIGGKILDIGDGYGDTLVSKIKQHPKSKRWLYLRAKVIASDFVDVCLADGYSIDDVILYESRCSKDILDVDVKKDDILIFTSPSSVECFLKKHFISKTNTVIVIGKTTAKALPNGCKYYISSGRSVKNCVEDAKKLLKSH